MWASASFFWVTTGVLRGRYTLGLPGGINCATTQQSLNMCTALHVPTHICAAIQAHLLRTVIVVGMHLTCKSTPVTRDRKGSMKGPEKGIKKLPSPEPV